MPRIFICYRRDDNAHFAGRLYDTLASAFGAKNVFRDIVKTRPGTNYFELLHEELDQCDVLLAVIGKRWLKLLSKKPANRGMRRLDDPEDLVRVEIISALSRGVQVIPVLFDGAVMPAEADLPDALKPLVALQAVNVPKEEFYVHRVQELIDSIRSPQITRRRKSENIITNSLGMKFAPIPPGEFWMGSPKDEAGRQPGA